MLNGVLKGEFGFPGCALQFYRFTLYFFSNDTGLNILDVMSGKWNSCSRFNSILRTRVLDWQATASHMILLN